MIEKQQVCLYYQCCLLRWFRLIDYWVGHPLFSEKKIQSMYEFELCSVTTTNTLIVLCDLMKQKISNVIESFYIKVIYCNYTVHETRKIPNTQINSHLVNGVRCCDLETRILTVEKSYVNQNILLCDNTELTFGSILIKLNQNKYCTDHP